MAAPKLKKGNEKTVVGFNNSLLPLGERNDIDLLAEIAVRSGNKVLLDLFESVPTIKELNKAKSAKFLAETSNVDNIDGDSGQITNTSAATSTE